MLTDEERLTRCAVVLQDAFGGQPSHFVQVDPPEGVGGTRWGGTAWKGDVLDPNPEKPPLFKVYVEVPDDEPHVVIVLTDRDGKTSNFVPRTYEQLARWAYDQSRIRGLQDWITPRHFTHLVNRVLELSPTVQYVENWPHRHVVELPDHHHLTYQWDADLCRLVATFSGPNGRIDHIAFREPEEALGWLAHLKDQF